MKKSERYYKAMVVVANSMMLEAEDKIEILSTLMEDRELAQYLECKDEEYAKAKEELG